MSRFVFLLAVTAIFSAARGHALTNSTSPIPIVLWHGMGDSCCFPFSLGKIKKMLEQEIGGVYVKSLKVGGNVVEDYESGYFMHPTKQILNVCAQVKADAALAGGFHAIGFSQGGLFLRGLIQRCPEAKVINLITLGAPHQGVFGLPNCNAISHGTCERLRELLSKAAYAQGIQNHLVQATYWHDPLQEDQYRRRSSFLANINNEYDLNEDYRANLRRLRHFVMVQFTEDTMVTPRQSAWFEFYAPGNDTVVVPLRESRVFAGLGLNEMDEQRKLVFLESVGNHLQFTMQWFKENLIKYLQ